MSTSVLLKLTHVVFECFTLAAILCMFLTGCHEFPFPATRGHLPRGATFAPNRRWPLVTGTTVLLTFASSCHIQNRKVFGLLLLVLFLTLTDKHSSSLMLSCP